MKRLVRKIQVDVEQFRSTSNSNALISGWVYGIRSIFLMMRGANKNTAGTNCPRMLESAETIYSCLGGSGHNINQAADRFIHGLHDLG